MKGSQRKQRAHTRQVERRSRKQRAMLAKRKRRTVPKSERIQHVASRQPQRGMPKLVRQAIGRMEQRARILQFPGVLRKAAGE